MEPLWKIGRPRKPKRFIESDPDPTMPKKRQRTSYGGRASSRGRNSQARKRLGTSWGGYTGSAVQREALKVIKKMKEKKQHFFQHNSTPDFNGNIQMITNINQGDNDTERDGSAIYLDNLQINGYISSNEGSTSAGVIGRVLVVLDRQPNGSVTTVSNVLEGSGSANVVNRYIDPQEASKRFRVLRDFKLPVDLNKPTYYDFYCPLYDTKTEYDSGQNIPISNSIFVINVSNSMDVDGVPNIRWETKVVYRD